MAEDLLTRIQQETHERLRELRGAVDEHERLRAEITVLDVVPEPSGDQELEAGPEMSGAPEPVGNVVRLPVTRPPARIRTVSPKVARRMCAPRRPARERPSAVRVGRRP